MMKFLGFMFMIMYMKIFNNILLFYFNLYFIMGILFFMMYYSNCNLLIFNSYYFGIDKYSFMLILLSLWIFGLMSMSISLIKEWMSLSIWFLMMMLILLLLFSMKNILMFYLFFEMSLIPTFILVIYWGGNPERLSAAFFLLMYMYMISFPLLIYLYYILKMMGSLDFYIVKIFMQNWSSEISMWSLMVILGAFLVKMPMFLFHSWLPKAHVEAPVYGSMLLAAILLKLGGFGLLRFINIFYGSMKMLNNLVLSFGMFGGMVMSMICLMQIDLKNLVAYSSIVHMNMVIGSMMSLVKLGHLGSLIIMISHGFCSSGLFYCVYLFYKQSMSRLILMNKGLIKMMVGLMIWWFFLCMSNLSFPLSISFIGEIYLFSSLVIFNKFLMFYLIFISMFSSIYSLYLYINLQHGKSNYNMKMYGCYFIESYLLMLHSYPLILILLKMSLFK